jgi:molybdopterin-guanine dinucleotide biosynthesis protein A
MITVIVLAGGRSSRFGGDKLAAELGGESVLGATIAAVAPLADAIVVAGPVRPDGLAAGEAPVTVVEDAEPFGGPLAALAGVLDAAVERRIEPGPFGLGLVVGGDMPRLVPAVLVRMLDVLDVDPSVDAVLLARPPDPIADSPAPRDGRAARRPVLPLAVRLRPAADAARVALAAGDRSLEALVDRLAHVELPAAAWQALDPGALTLADIDTRADLDRLRAT